MDFAFYLCLPGALAAILIPSNDYAIVYSGMTISYYIFHGLIFLIPLMMAHWKLYDPQPSVKKAVKLTIMVLLLGGALHLFNVFMYQNFRIPANTSSQSKIGQHRPIRHLLFLPSGFPMIFSIYCRQYRFYICTCLCFLG
jgi:hypothetical protein